MATPLPDQDQRISLDDAAKLTAAKRAAGGDQPARPFAWHRLVLDRILQQPNCVGIRVYPGQHDDKSDTWVIVGVDNDGNDMVDGALAQEPIWCPPICPDDNALNSGGT